MAKSIFSGTGFGDEFSPGIRVGVGRYILKRLLGHGEISEVWLAQDVKNSREVALKFLPQALLSDANLIERLKQETQRNFLLAHPHIAATYEFVRDHDSAAIAVEFVDGWSLATFKIDKPQQRYRVEEIKPWIRQLCAALEFAHNQFGIVHSDLKPSNLLLNAQDEIKITDFGITRSIQIESSKRGLIKGASGGIGFLSPQQVMGGEPSKADDVYSLGATIFDLLTGTPPFYKGEIVAQICGLKPQSMTERLRELKIEDSIPPAWENAVAKCLAKNPAERPQSADEALQLLQRLEMAKPAEGKTAEVGKKAGAPVEIKLPEPEKPDPAAKIPPVIETPPGISSKPKSKTPVLIAAAALFVLLIFAAGIFGFRHLKLFGSGAAAHIAISTNSLVATIKPGPPGSLDKSFDAGTGADNDVRSIAVQPDGKILIGGRFNFFNGANAKGIARLNADGSFDPAFKFHANNTVHAIVLQDDGDIVAGGDFTVIGGKRHPHFARLHPDGGVDQSFGRSAVPNGEVRSIAVQPDGQILISGTFTMLSGKSQNRLARVDSDGVPDDAFNSNVNSPMPVWTVAVQPDGKILAGGSFTNFNGTAAGRIVRLNSDGTLDPNFNTGAGADAVVLATAVQSDGGILIAGDFLNVDHVPCHRIARLNPDGTVDSTFDDGDGANSTVHALTIQPDGKILVGGAFTEFAGVACNRIVRLNADGSLDKSFNAGQGASDVIWKIVIQPDGKILAGGAFKSFDGLDCGGIVRLQN